MRIFTGISIITAAIFLTACSTGTSEGSNNSTNPDEPKISLLGKWNYQIQNSNCEGLIAEGTVLIQSQNEPRPMLLSSTPDVPVTTGDHLVAPVSSDSGETLAQAIYSGDTIEITSSGDCYLSPYNVIDRSISGLPADMSKSEYKKYVYARHSGLSDVEITKYNPAAISIEIKHSTNTEYTDLFK